MKRALCAAAILSALAGCAANSTCPSGGEAWPSRHVTAASTRDIPVARRARADDAADNLAPLAGSRSWRSGSDPLDVGPANEKGKSYLIPAAEIIGFEILLNQYDRHFGDEQKAYDTDWETIKDNLHSGWVIDRLAHRVALQGSALAGIGFGAGGTIADDRTDRDYHYGAIPQGTLDLRVVLGEEAMLGLTGRDYFVFGSGVDHNGQSENITQSEISLTVRVYGPHALTVRYVHSFRNANYSSVPDQEQSVESISVLYSFLGATRFGVVGRGTP